LGQVIDQCLGLSCVILRCICLPCVVSACSCCMVRNCLVLSCSILVLFCLFSCCLGVTCLVLVCIFLCSVLDSVVLSFSPYFRESGLSAFRHNERQSGQSREGGEHDEKHKVLPCFVLLQSMCCYIVSCYISTCLFTCLFILVFPLYCYTSLLSLYLIVPALITK
jgi:hypothetical protein